MKRENGSSLICGVVEHFLCFHYSWHRNGNLRYLASRMSASSHTGLGDIHGSCREREGAESTHLPIVHGSCREKEGPGEYTPADSTW